MNKKTTTIMIFLIIIYGIVISVVVFINNERALKREIINKNSPKILIQSPLPSDIIKIGKEYFIKWELKNVKDNYRKNPVDISIRGPYLMDTCESYGGVASCDQNIFSIARSAPNTGSYLWRVGPEIKPGKYKIEIFSPINNTSGYGGNSDDYFQIELSEQ